MLSPSPTPWRLVALGRRRLNQPQWVERPDASVLGWPACPVARDDAAAKELEARAGAKRYNARPLWLDNEDAAVDATPVAAYGPDRETTEDDALRALLALL